MVNKRPATADVIVEHPPAAVKRRRSSGRSLALVDIPHHIDALKQNGHTIETDLESHSPDSTKEKSITITSTAKFADQTVAPFLTRHIPQQYAPLGGLNSSQGKASKDPNSRFCYRHRPDLLCRRQADEPSMDQLQRVR